MTRHAKNCTAGAVYTYHEKKKDTKSGGYGTLHMRLGKDSVKDFDCCCLSLQPCRNPVITPQGVLYDKEAILEYILHQKREYARKLKEYEKSKRREQTELEELGLAEKRSQVEKFTKNEQSIVTKPHNAFKTTEPSTSISNMVGDKSKQLPSFWIPSLTPEAKKTQLKKPDKTVYCPITNIPIAMKDLIPINFTPVVDPDDKASLIAKRNRYMCAVTHDILGNTVPCAVLRPTGHVVTMECVEKIIKIDWLHPISGEKLTERDIIPVEMGGTGYSTTNALKAAVATPSMQS
ncbi:hypothetical protein CHUAL_012829 [Chamberlinius hualienensis]